MHSLRSTCPSPLISSMENASSFSSPLSKKKSSRSSLTMKPVSSPLTFQYRKDPIRLASPSLWIFSMDAELSSSLKATLIWWFRMYVSSRFSRRMTFFRRCSSLCFSSLRWRWRSRFRSARSNLSTDGEAGEASESGAPSSPSTSDPSPASESRSLPQEPGLPMSRTKGASRASLSSMSPSDLPLLPLLDRYPTAVMLFLIVTAPTLPMAPSVAFRKLCGFRRGPKRIRRIFSFRRAASSLSCVIKPSSQWVFRHNVRLLVVSLCSPPVECRWVTRWFDRSFVPSCSRTQQTRDNTTTQ